MLQPMLFCPALAWTAQTLCDCGIHRFFLVCDDAFAQEALSCLPKQAEVLLSDAIPSKDMLGSGPVLFLSHPMLPVGPETALPLYSDIEQTQLAGNFSLPYTEFDSFSGLQALMPLCRADIARRHREAGVLLLDPENCYIDPRCHIGAGTLILPGTLLRGQCAIGENCQIGPNTMLTDCTVGSDTLINASQCIESEIGSSVRIGPFSYLRPNCHVADHAKIGDFVEVKNSTIGEKTSIAHLTYVGDSDVGTRVNFGCGTVTTNYDGAKKYRCRIGSGSFIGCNTNLIAPVSVGDGAYIAAGSTITKDVPADSLAIARCREETVKEGWAAKRRAILKSKY